MAHKSSLQKKLALRNKAFHSQDAKSFYEMSNATGMIPEPNCGETYTPEAQAWQLYNQGRRHNQGRRQAKKTQEPSTKNTTKKELSDIVMDPADVPEHARKFMTRHKEIDPNWKDWEYARACKQSLLDYASPELGESTIAFIESLNHNRKQDREKILSIYFRNKKKLDKRYGHMKDEIIKYQKSIKNKN